MPHAPSARPAVPQAPVARGCRAWPCRPSCSARRRPSRACRRPSRRSAVAPCSPADRRVTVNRQLLGECDGHCGTASTEPSHSQSPHLVLAPPNPVGIAGLAGRRGHFVLVIREPVAQDRGERQEGAARGAEQRGLELARLVEGLRRREGPTERRSPTAAAHFCSVLQVLSSGFHSVLGIKSPVSTSQQRKTAKPDTDSSV